MLNDIQAVGTDTQTTGNFCKIYSFGGRDVELYMGPMARHYSKTGLLGRTKTVKISVSKFK